MSDLRVYLPSPRLWKARCAYSRASGRCWREAVVEVWMLDLAGSCWLDLVQTSS